MYTKSWNRRDQAEGNTNTPKPFSHIANRFDRVVVSGQRAQLREERFEAGLVVVAECVETGMTFAERKPCSPLVRLVGCQSRLAVCHLAVNPGRVERVKVSDPEDRQHLSDRSRPVTRRRRDKLPLAQVRQWKQLRLLVLCRQFVGLREAS